MAPVEIAPAAYAALARFDKIDRALVFIPPASTFDRFLPRIDLYHRTWAKQRIHRVILQPDIAED
jgi:hypothetical protein